MRPGAISATPDETMSGRPVPAKAEPSASIALRSAAPFSAKREKSWLNAV
jgi:hypothetical protein